MNINSVLRNFKQKILVCLEVCCYFISYNEITCGFVLQNGALDSIV